MDLLDVAVWLASGALATGAITYRLMRGPGRMGGIEPSVPEGRGDRSPHEHHYDTDYGDGHWYCGTCRKKRKMRR